MRNNFLPVVIFETFPLIFLLKRELIPLIRQLKEPLDFQTFPDWNSWLHLHMFELQAFSEKKVHFSYIFHIF